MAGDAPGLDVLEAIRKKYGASAFREVLLHGREVEEQPRAIDVEAIAAGANVSPEEVEQQVKWYQADHEAITKKGEKAQRPSFLKQDLDVIRKNEKAVVKKRVTANVVRKLPADYQPSEKQRKEAARRAAHAERIAAANENFDDLVRLESINKGIGVERLRETPKNFKGKTPRMAARRALYEGLKGKRSAQEFYQQHGPELIGSRTMAEANFRRIQMDARNRGMNVSIGELREAHEYFSAAPGDLAAFAVEEEVANRRGSRKQRPEVAAREAERLKKELARTRREADVAAQLKVKTANRPLGVPILQPGDGSVVQNEPTGEFWEDVVAGHRRAWAWQPESRGLQAVKWALLLSGILIAIDLLMVLYRFLQPSRWPRVSDVGRAALVERGKRLAAQFKWFATGPAGFSTDGKFGWAGSAASRLENRYKDLRLVRRLIWKIPAIVPGVFLVSMWFGIIAFVMMFFTQGSWFQTTHITGWGVHVFSSMAAACINVGVLFLNTLMAGLGQLGGLVIALVASVAEGTYNLTVLPLAHFINDIAERVGAEPIAIVEFHIDDIVNTIHNRFAYLVPRANTSCDRVILKFFTTSDCGPLWRATGGFDLVGELASSTDAKGTVGGVLGAWASSLVSDAGSGISSGWNNVTDYLSDTWKNLTGGSA